MPCESLKKIDLFGVPVSLVYKGNTTFTTRVGGIFSLMWAIIMISVFIQDTITVYVFGENVSVQHKTELEFYSSSNDNIDILNSNYTMMGRLFTTFDFVSQLDVDSIARI